ncbi:3-oxoadipate enol-lactonase [Kribbella capetownensis]|uniref:3-oxoadipate enol-lactonase n=1 Tax=Kribbella capetownensis TaxID=1572659 RepID=A0A4R0JQT6_9ACTN|nr:3-oxoadipate enol-lactonase [Kribbella capetownensis]TCC48827.1 3-oxoadipate enol-lactonase [Kribbella capetownensis]
MNAVDHVVTGRAGGPVVVLSNSLGARWSMWDANLAAWEEHFRVVRYDTRGHGRSAGPAGPYTIDDLADDVIALLDRLGVERAHFVGLSLGGMTGLRLAARNPERMDRLVVLCTGARLEPVQAWTDRAATVRVHGAGAIAEAVVRRWFTQADPLLRKECEEMVGSTAAEGYAACCEAIATMDLRPDLPAITAPTLAIAGADDPATPPYHLEQIVTTVADGRLIVVPGSAHLANAERPDVITPAVTTHLTAG